MYPPLPISTRYQLSNKTHKTAIRKKKLTEEEGGGGGEYNTIRSRWAPRGGWMGSDAPLAFFFWIFTANSFNLKQFRSSKKKQKKKTTHAETIQKDNSINCNSFPAAVIHKFTNLKKEFYWDNLGLHFDVIFNGITVVLWVDLLV